MRKITFMGAGSTVFAKNVLGDCLLSEKLKDFEIALIDVDEERLNESYALITALRDKYKKEGEEFIIYDCPLLIEAGLIAGGMGPKVRGCIHAIRNGVDEVSILDGRTEHVLLLDVLDERVSGTVFTE